MARSADTEIAACRTLSPWRKNKIKKSDQSREVKLGLAGSAFARFLCGVPPLSPRETRA